ncbi:hypothetical protein RB195_003309 [Necator americanus]|uniref:Uncharacterized protein n=1 Tax=Necator americanus TaxID=51031 RepID=A0ABR1DNB5_NECAM
MKHGEGAFCTKILPKELFPPGRCRKCKYTGRESESGRELKCVTDNVFVDDRNATSQLRKWFNELRGRIMCRAFTHSFMNPPIPVMSSQITCTMN